MLTLLNVDIISVYAFDQYIFVVILGVEAGQRSYVVLNVDPNLSINVLINKVLIKKRVYRDIFTAYGDNKNHVTGHSFL